MKKIVSIGLLLALFTLVFSLPLAAAPNPSINTNTEILLRELNACRDAVLPTINPNAFIHITPPWEPAVLAAAQRLDSLGVKEIIEIKVTFDIEDGMTSGFYVVDFTDIDGIVCDMLMEEAGAAVHIKAGEKYWTAYDSGPPVPSKWWQKAPKWVQWIFRYIFFGWIWMVPTRSEWVLRYICFGWIWMK